VGGVREARSGVRLRFLPASTRQAAQACAAQPPFALSPAQSLRMAFFFFFFFLIQAGVALVFRHPSGHPAQARDRYTCYGRLGCVVCSCLLDMPREKAAPTPPRLADMPPAALYEGVHACHSRLMQAEAGWR